MSQNTSLAEIEYQGRQTKRADGRERRNEILKATLRVIVRDGIRGARHRAIAQEAKVPLASTTYYFKDIVDLITDAFNLYAETALRERLELEKKSFAAIGKFSPSDLKKANVRSQLVMTLTSFLMEYINNRISSRDLHTLEQAFRNEALRNEKLAQTVSITESRLEQVLVKFFSRLGSPCPQETAHIIHGTVLHLEYLALTTPETMDKKTIESTVRRLIRTSFLSDYPG